MFTVHCVLVSCSSLVIIFTFTVYSVHYQYESEYESVYTSSPSPAITHTYHTDCLTGKKRKRSITSSPIPTPAHGISTVHCHCSRWPLSQVRLVCCAVAMCCTLTKRLGFWQYVTTTTNHQQHWHCAFQRQRKASISIISLNRVHSPRRDNNSFNTPWSIGPWPWPI